MFQRILVANRGEIALRVIRACRDLGIEVVAVYSQADRGAPYLDLADQAICIGPASSAESYLKIPRIISAAEIANVQAIHPGYGFLSENPHFAEICRACNIEFIGPTEEAMKLLGNKNEARKLAKQAGVPMVPGSEGLIDNDADALKLAHEMGYPVLIKAAAGGGGRGMRVARNDISLQTGLKAAKQEAENAFKDGSVYLEKYIEQPRHIEVQILADRHGNYVHLWERDCSLQRRHQKLVEESPAPNLPADVRGMASMKTNASGSQYFANLGARKPRRSSAVHVQPARSTMTASGRSPHRGWLTPITAASRTLGWPISAFSSSCVAIHSPPLLMRSAIRSVSWMNPCASTRATSPVLK